MLKYLAKISMDIFPSVLATIIGAYIVNHYINAKPATETPAAISAPAQDHGDGKSSETANLPAHGVKAKGVPDKSAAEKSVADKAAADKPEAKAAEGAPADAHGRAAREKTAKAAAAPVTEANSAPSGSGPTAGPDANDLARAAIERLRKSPEGKAAEAKAEARTPEAKATEVKAPEAKTAERTPEAVTREAARSPETPRVVPSAEAAAVRPLPPPITVASPTYDPYSGGTQSPSYTASVGASDPDRVTPPADIPVPVLAPPLDLRADAGASLAPRPKKTNVADDVLSGMKSMFHSVLPKGATPD